MKKLGILLFIVLLSFSCSSDDNENIDSEDRSEIPPKKDPEPDNTNNPNDDGNSDDDSDDDNDDNNNSDSEFDFTGMTPPKAPDGMEWKKVEALSDEFNSTFNTNKWFKPLWNYGIPVQMVAQNSGVSDGNLWIKATLDESNERWFMTSRVQSRAQITYPMYTVSRIKNAHLSAYNTFWMNNGDINNRDEIDIIENNSKPSCNCQPDFPWQMSSQYFITVNKDDDRNKGNFDNRNLSKENPLKGVRWNEDYHTVGAWWIDDQNVQFYLNGEPAGKVTTKRKFSRSLNLIWDLWTFDAPWLGGLALKSDLTNNQVNTMKVDWVHTYKLVKR